MMAMPGTKKKWQVSDFLILEEVEYRPEADQVRVRFRDGDRGEVATWALWRERPGLPDWNRVGIDLATRSALLVPTFPGHPTTQGTVAEILSDVIRVQPDDPF